jgi:hypothetical protein
MFPVPTKKDAFQMSRALLALESLCKDFPTIHGDVENQTPSKDRKIVFGIVCLLSFGVSVLFFVGFSDYPILIAASGVILVSAPITLFLQSKGRKDRLNLFMKASKARSQWLEDRFFDRALMQMVVPASFHFDMLLQGLLIIGGFGLAGNVILLLLFGTKTYFTSFLGYLLGNMPTFGIHYYRYILALRNERKLSKS